METMGRWEQEAVLSPSRRSAQACRLASAPCRPGQALSASNARACRPLGRTQKVDQFAFALTMIEIYTRRLPWSAPPSEVRVRAARGEGGARTRCED